MADPFLGEIRAFGFSFVPPGWVACDGSLLPIRLYSALFSLLGVNFGGDGRTTFGVPDLRGGAAIGSGAASGLSPYAVGQSGGTPTVTLQESEIPAHPHTVLASPDGAELQAPAPDRALARSTPGFVYRAVTPDAAMSTQAIGMAGGGTPHDNMAPALVVQYAIATTGIFPQRP